MHKNIYGNLEKFNKNTMEKVDFANKRIDFTNKI